jgi:L-threonylcarbamoyladenylate synthase
METKTILTEDLNNACRVLRAGGLILYPTDTVWGIGCDATNAHAVERIYALKQRSGQEPMLVLIDSARRLAAYLEKEETPYLAQLLMKHTHRPLTIVYPNVKNLAPNLPAADGSAGFRITTELFSHRLCQRFRKPIVSTSANLSGQPTPARFREISDAIRQGVDYVVRFRQNETLRAEPSSIIKIDAEGDGMFIIRE